MKLLNIVESFKHKGTGMKTAKKHKIIAEIFQKKQQLEKLKPYIGVSKMSNDFYNKILIEKAVLKKHLGILNKSKWTKFFENLFKPRRKMICDYFKDKCPMI